MNTQIYGIHLDQSEVTCLGRVPGIHNLVASSKVELFTLTRTVESLSWERQDELTRNRIISYRTYYL